MNEQTITYLNRLKEKYRFYEDNDSLMALADIETQAERARELEIYRDQPKTQELIKAAILSFKECVIKLTNESVSKPMTSEERAYLFAKMDWSRFTLDIVGETPERLLQTVDSIILDYAKKAGITL